MNQNENKIENDTQKKESAPVKKSTMAIIILLLLLLIVGVILVMLTLKKTPEGVVLDPMSGKYETPVELPEEAVANRIIIPALKTIDILADSDTANAVLLNPESNPCYFQYSIVLADTEETIYESGMIAPGNAVQEVKFNRTFPQGIYPITIRISTFSLTDPEQPMNGGEIKSELVAIVE